MITSHQCNLVKFPSTVWSGCLTWSHTIFQSEYIKVSYIFFKILRKPVKFLSVEVFECLNLRHNVSFWNSFNFQFSNLPIFQLKIDLLSVKGTIEANRQTYNLQTKTCKIQTIENVAMLFAFRRLNTVCIVKCRDSALRMHDSGDWTILFAKQWLPCW